MLNNPALNNQALTPDDIRAKVKDFLAAHDPATTPRLDFLRARYDAGLAWVHYPEGRGGLGAPRALQTVTDQAFAAAGAPTNDPGIQVIGLGMAAPTILAFGNAEQQQQLAAAAVDRGGDLVPAVQRARRGQRPGLARHPGRARRRRTWIVNGQKVWTSLAHQARWAILVARTDPDVPKHQGLSYFVCDMTDPGVDVRPLRQLTGEAEFNEVFLTDVRIPDTDRIGQVGEGWKVAQGTLMNERVAIGGAGMPREGGMIGLVTRAWRDHPERRSPGLHDRLLRLWADAEVARLASLRLRQQLAAGQPGPEGSAAKVTFARLNQEISGLDVELAGPDGLRYGDWSMRRPAHAEFLGRDPGFRYLRAKGNSIEGGTSEVLRNIIAERVLGLPSEPRVDKDVPWKDLPR